MRVSKPAIFTAILMIGALAPIPALAEVTSSTVQKIALAGDSQAVGLDPFVMVGLSWTGPTSPTLQVQASSGWEEVLIDPTGPDQGPDQSTSEELKDIDNRSFSEPVWVGEASGYRVNSQGSKNLTIHLIREISERVPVSSIPPAGAAIPSDGPAVNSRVSWGASAPKTANDVAKTIRLAVVHHTAGTNNYTQDQVPSILRSIQAFHQNSRGWNDIAYNFLVDKWGGIWEGRAGGIDRPIIGSHAAGVNTGSVGISLMGDFTTTGATAEALEATAQVVGWKLALHGVNPLGTVTFTNGGSNRYAEGAVLTLPTVIGHKDIGNTDCPGSVHNSLPDIRNRAAQRPKYVSGELESLTIAGGSVSFSGWAFDRRTSQPIDVAVELNGRYLTSVAASTNRADLGTRLQGHVATVGFAGSVNVPEGDLRVCLYGREASAQAYTLLKCGDLYRLFLSPLGALTSAERDGPNLRLRGWAGEEGLAAPLTVRATIDGAVVSESVASEQLTADPRPRVSAGHGYTLSVPISEGTHTYCVVAVNQGEGSDRQVGCTDFSSNNDPIGSLDLAVWWGSYVVVAGWAGDPDSAGPLTVRFTDNGVPVAAAVARSFRATMPGFNQALGSFHGFELGLKLNPAISHTICVSADNSNGALGPQLGCRTVGRKPPTTPAPKKTTKKSAPKKSTKKKATTTSKK